MSHILLKIENAGAERLWNYIIAYRRMIGEIHQTNDKSSKDTIVFGLMPTPKQAKIMAKPKRKIKKHL